MTPGRCEDEPPPGEAASAPLPRTNDPTLHIPDPWADQARPDPNGAPW